MAPTLRRRSRRGQSTLIGLVLLVGMVIVGVTGILAFGTPVLKDAQQQAAISNAEQAMTQLDSKAGIVALSDSSGQRVRVGVGGSDVEFYADDDAGWMNVSIVNESTGSAETVVMNASLGAVVYEHGGTTIAYQGGGVWQQWGNGSSMISPPSFHYRVDDATNPTLTLPLVTVDSDGALGGTVVITQNGSTESKYPDGSLSNPVSSGRVNITVHSEYYEAWGAFFEARTDGTVTYDHTRKTVTLELTILTNHPPITSAMSATAADGTLEVRGTGPYLDSYNSSNGSYASQTPGSNGNITYGGDIEVSGDATINGNLKAGGDITLDSNAMSLDGRAYYTWDLVDPHDKADETTEIDGVPTITPVNDLVDDNVSDLRDDNDNDSVSDTIDDIENADCDECELTAGRYFLTKIELDQGDTLVLNTTGGDIDIAVEDYIHLAGTGGNEANVTVTGNGTVRIYVNGEDGIETDCHYDECELAIGQNGIVYVPNDTSTRLRIYGKDDFKTTIEGAGGNTANFTGIVYAPAGDDGDGAAFLKHAEVFGAIVTGQAVIEQGASLHYDTAIRAQQLAPDDEITSTITYLHVSVTRINVTST